MSEELWVPADGDDGCVYLTYDSDGIARVHREAMSMLLARAGFKRDDKARP